MDYSQNIKLMLVYTNVCIEEASINAYLKITLPVVKMQ